jgi:hypothetical protein
MRAFASERAAANEEKQISFSLLTGKKWSVKCAARLNGEAAKRRKRRSRNSS